MVFGKHLICQKVIVPYMTYADNGILFAMKAIEKKLCRVVYGVRLHRLTRFEKGTVRKTEVIADRTIRNKWSRLSCLRHQITSDWRVFECVDAKQAT